MQDASAKQLVSEKIKNVTNVLVTVSANPSVDELSAALGLTLLLNKLDKHATAVFSGDIPPAITFLDPRKTFENTVDSLRDFIIALDKEKADRLRTKVVDDVVRIFITPYRTTISEKDLQFSQGDFNVELIIALGVQKREDLDKAIQSHGRILHDAVVVTVNAGEKVSSLGAIDWQDQSASSLSEMLVGMSESLGANLFDQQIANAFLTGIVAATDRFSNNKTSPKVMTMSAQLMAAGANQQLIATKLTEAREIGEAAVNKTATSKNDKVDSSVKISKQNNKPASPPQKKKSDPGEMKIEHDTAQEKALLAAKRAETARQSASPEPAQSASEPEAQLPAPVLDTPEDVAATEELTKDLAEANAVETAKLPSVADLQADIAKQSAEVESAAEEPANEPIINPIKTSSWKERRIEPPTMGGSLTATSDQALKDKIKAEEDDKNRTILTHKGTTAAENTTNQPAFNSYGESEDDGNISIDPMAAQPSSLAPPANIAEPAPQMSSGVKTLAELEADARSHSSQSSTIAPAAVPTVDASPLGDARSAVDSALEASFDPAHNPTESIGAMPMTAPLHEQPAANMPQPPQPDFSLPPLPDMSTLPPLPDGGVPQFPSATTTGVSAPVPASEAPQPLPQADNGPGQFKIPGQ